MVLTKPCALQKTLMKNATDLYAMGGEHSVT